MKRMIFWSALCLVSALCVSSPSPSVARSPASAGRYTWDNPYVRVTPAKVSAAYIVIKNPTPKDDALISASADWAGRAELHEISTDDTGVMSMKRAKSVPLPAHGTAELKPGGYHIMIFGVKNPVTLNETKNITLRFKSGAELTVPFTARPITYTGGHRGGLAPRHDHSAH